ncbi:hypothetical protein [Streptomyces sp. AD55]|uniref:hypothetical protein n=1 Tax=Streptomyces sp. AD55 TaxID=3242895 RepID=UPI0035270741
MTEHGRRVGRVDQGDRADRRGDLIVLIVGVVLAHRVREARFDDGLYAVQPENGTGMWREAP